ncbi:putative Ig domain-containing protein [Dyella sp. SG609]|uniref:putative Ig domain-containing protein n=1 Tax=Dyella sp. SG609 TaxID=2587018 RepID=UPI00144654BE|nr:putative Ig domain-containing protein [Dyella sp. SG609]NKJ21391.1 YD repeat-containing protein [Dyella sp. SG609]
MVAVIAGNGLGLGNTSLTQLGQAQGGASNLGQAQSRQYVNAANGNLVLQGQDQGLLFDDLPLNQLRTYNSLSPGGGSQGWLFGFSRSIGGLAGTVNTAGSTVSRVADDGSMMSYAYNASAGAYLSTGQSGSVDTLTWNAASSSWTRTDGASRQQETYNAAGQLTGLSSPESGASYSFGYNGNQLTTITASDGDVLTLGYDGNGRLGSISVTEVPPGQTAAVTRQEVSYTYDAQGRLGTVTTTLASDTNSSSSASYTTTYGYDGGSDRVASVTQSDGTVASYTYAQDSQGVYRVASATTGTGAAAQTVNFSYDLNGDTTTVSNALGQAWTYGYNAAGQLTQVTAPSVNGASPATHYSYDASGNLLQSVDANGAATRYSYDANGNLLSVTDATGHAVSYTYNADNQVTSKTVYAVAAQGTPGQGGYVAPSGAQTTYYVYDAGDRLNFTVDPLGAVTEHDYTVSAAGLSELSTTRTYLGASYDTSAATPANPPSLANLQAWVASSPVQNTLAQATRTDYSYDVRGQLASSTVWGTLAADGTGAMQGGNIAYDAVQTSYTYDASGRLLQTIRRSGTDRSSLATTSYAYDGMGRLIGSTDALGYVTSYTYSDSQNTLAIHQANGLVTTEVRNSAGQLVSRTQAATGQPSRVTSYLYNAAGQSVATIDPAGNGSFTFYDADGRVTGTVDATGAVTAYAYDADGRVVRTTDYATPVSTSGWISGGALTASLPAALPVPSGSADDRIADSVYDSAGRAVASIDGLGNVVTVSYDGAGRALSSLAYATPLTATQRAGLGTPPTLSALNAVLASNSADRLAQTVYDADGRTVASIDAAGYVTITSYDNSGNAVLVTAYATALTPSQRSGLGTAPTLASLQAVVTSSSTDQITRNYYDRENQLVGSIDPAGYLTVRSYQELTTASYPTAVRMESDMRYAQPLTAAQIAVLPAHPGYSDLVAAAAAAGQSAGSALQQVQRFYDADGRLAEVDAINGAETTYTQYSYDSAGRQARIKLTTSGVALTAERSTITVYDGYGDLVSTTDPVNAFAGYTYNTLGQKTQSRDAAGNITWYYYGSDERLAYTVQGQSSGSTLNALASVTAYTYNAFGQVTASTAYASLLSLVTSGSSSGTTLNANAASTADVAAAVAALPASAADPNQQVSTTYDADGNVVMVTSGDGYHTATAYDAFGDVSQVTRQLSGAGSALSGSNSTVTQYVYDARGERVQEADGVGGAATQASSATYDAFGRVTSRTDANNNVVTYSYDPLGRQVGSSQTVQGQVRTTQTTYDAIGRVLTAVDGVGNTTTYQYDPTGLTTTIITPGGIHTVVTKDPFGDTLTVTDGAGNVTTSTYDADGRLLTTTDALGNVRTNHYDLDGNLSQTAYAVGSNFSYKDVSYTYDAAGRVLTQTVDPGSAVTTYAYDGEGRRLRVTDPLGTVTTYSYDADGNTLTQVQDAGSGKLNITTTYSYDGAGNVLTVTHGAGTSAAAATQYVYDNLGRLTQKIDDPSNLALSTRYTYDGDNHLLSVTDAGGNVTRYVYDEAGEKVFTIDPTGAVTRMWYDADGRLTTTRGYATLLTANQLSALGAAPTLAAVAADVTNTASDSYQQSVYNADGQVAYALSGTTLNATQYSYNADGQVSQVRRYAAPLSTGSISPTATSTAVASYITAGSSDLQSWSAYDANGEAVYQIDGTGGVTQRVFDANGNVTRSIAYATALTTAQLAALGSAPTAAQVAAVVTTSAADRSSYAAYDGLGRQLYAVGATGAVTQTSYDANGRVTATTAYINALTPAQLAGLGNAPTDTQIHGLLTASNYDRHSYAVYDAAGEQRYAIDAMGNVKETRYDAAGRVTEVLGYANAVAGVPGTLAQVASAVSAAGNTDANAQATLYLYDSAGRQRFTVRQNQGGTVGAVTEQRYDANGNIVARIAYANTLALSTSQPLSAQLNTASVASAVAGAPAAGMQITSSVYDADSREIYHVDALGDVTQNGYDAFGRTVSVQQYAHAITVPASITAATIAAAVAAAGGATGARVSTTTYDTRGNVLSTGDALGVNATYSYDGRGLKTGATNRDGAAWTYSYDTTGRLVQTGSPAVTVGSYNTGGALQSAANQYLYTTTAYDTFGEATSVTQGYGTAPTAITAVSTVHYAYDAAGHRVQTTDAMSGVSTATYDAFGDQVVSKDANGNYDYRVYDNDGRLIGAIDGAGGITSWSYDAYGNAVSAAQHAAPFAGLGGSWTAGQPVTPNHFNSSTSSGDRITTTTYDQWNQKTQVAQAAISMTLGMGPLAGQSATAAPTTVYTYDAYGNLVTSAVLLQPALTVGGTSSPAVWATTNTYYDALHRVVMVVTPTGSYTSPQGYVTTTAYDAFGEVATRTDYAQAISASGLSTSTMPALPPAGNQTTGDNRVTTYAYDAIGRVLSQTLTGDVGYVTSNGATQGALSSGNPTDAISASVTSYTYDGEGRVLSKSVNGIVTTTTYDALGRVATVTDPACQALVSNWAALLQSNPGWDLTTASLYTSVSPVTSYVYDAQGHALSTTVAAGGLSQQSLAVFDAAGRMTSSTDADGTRHSKTYDANGNLRTDSYTLTGSTTVTTTNTYDGNDQLLSTTVQRSGTATYDSYTQQQRNAFGEISAKGDNNGYELSYTYNAAGQLLTSTDSKTGVVHTMSYDLAGHLISDSASGQATTSTLDLSGRVVTRLLPATNATSGANTAHSSYGYDRWGNVISSTDANGNTTTYTYDDQDRLFQTTEASTLVVSAQGNYANTSSTTVSAYNANGELMGSKDENGVWLWKTYDSAGHLTMAQDGVGNRTYTAYDALGRAVAQQTPPAQTATGTVAQITFTSYDNLNQVTGQGYFQLNGAGTARSMVTQQTLVLDANGDRIQVTDALGNSSYYTYDGQKRVLSSQTALQHANSQSKTYGYDVNGYLIHQVDANGNSQSWVYDAFGRVQSHVDESGATYNYTYNATTGLLATETSNWSPTGPAGSTTSTLTFTYEADGQVASLNEVVNGATSNYTYSYDANGNVVRATVATQDGGGTAVGNQTLIGYDSHNRVQEVTVENAAGTVATMRSVYVYDAAGNRRAVFTANAAGPNGAAATPIPLTTGGPTLTTALTAQSVPPGTALNYAIGGNFNDALGMGLSYAVSGMPSWLSFNATSQTFTGTPPVPTAVGSSTITVVATDALGHTVSTTVAVAVQAVAPVFSGAVSNQTVQPGAGMSYTAPAATDNNGEAVTYTATGLPAGLTFNASTRTISGTISSIAAATYAITYKATSTSGTSVSTSFNITVPAVAPAFTGGMTNQTVQPGGSLSYQAPTATDANGYTVSYSASGLPSGISFNASTRTFSGSLTTAGTYTVTYTATSSAGTTASQTFTITVPAVTPVFTGGVSNLSGTASVVMNSYQAPTATDANGYAISYSASNLPPGISFDPSSRIFSGTPTTAGTWTVTYTATSTANTVASTTFTITVGAASAPVYNGGMPTGITFNAGDSETWTVPAGAFSNPMGRPLSYNLQGNKPPGVEMSPSGVITANVPASALKQAYSCSVVAWDPADSLSVSVPLRIQILTGIGTLSAQTMSAGASSPAPEMMSVQTAQATQATTPNVVADWYTYDADNRVVVANGALQNGQILMTTATNSASNAYDAAGNVVTYTTEQSAGQYTTQRNSYDALNQLTMIQNEAPGSSTFATYETRSYDLDGRLSSDVTWNLPGHQGAGTLNGNVVTFNDAGWVATDTFYSYNADGELVDQSEYAEEGAQALINQYGNNVATSYQDTTAPSAPSGATAGSLYLATEKNYAAAGAGYGYDADGNALGYRVTTGSVSTVVNGSPVSGTIGYQNAYIKQNGLLLASTTPTLISGGGTVNQPTVNTYNDLGELSKTTGTVNGTSQTQVMAYTAGGQMAQQSTTTSSGTVTTTYESVNEQQLGSVDTAGAINVLSTTGGYSNSTQGAQNYTVRAGDTLRSIAMAVYGNSNYDYILAEANGLSIDSTLPLGMVLRIPQVTTSTNAYDNFQPYSQGTLLGGGAAAFDTAGQAVALSIEAQLSQQSALAKTVAQIEQAAQQWAAQQAAALAAQQAAAKAAAAAQMAAAQAASAQAAVQVALAAKQAAQQAEDDARQKEAEQQADQAAADAANPGNAIAGLFGSGGGGNTVTNPFNSSYIPPIPADDGIDISGDLNFDDSSGGDDGWGSSDDGWGGFGNYFGGNYDTGSSYDYGSYGNDWGADDWGSGDTGSTDETGSNDAADNSGDTTSDDPSPYEQQIALDDQQIADSEQQIAASVQQIAVSNEQVTQANDAQAQANAEYAQYQGQYQQAVQEAQQAQAEATQLGSTLASAMTVGAMNSWSDPDVSHINLQSQQDVWAAAALESSSQSGGSELSNFIAPGNNSVGSTAMSAIPYGGYQGDLLGVGPADYQGGPVYSLHPLDYTLPAYQSAETFASQDESPATVVNLNPSNVFSQGNPSWLSQADDQIHGFNEIVRNELADEGAQDLHDGNQAAFVWGGIKYSFYQTFMPDSVEQGVVGIVGGKVAGAGIGYLAKGAVSIAPILGRDVGSLAGDVGKSVGGLLDNLRGSAGSVDTLPGPEAPGEMPEAPEAVPNSTPPVPNTGLTGVPINGATRSVPLGFESETQFHAASQELIDAMAENGFNDATVGVRGSSVTGFGSNPRSPTFGQPFGPSSDIDLFVESSDVVSAFKNQPNFIHPDRMIDAYPNLDAWSQKWSEILGRPVSPAAWKPGALPSTPAILVKPQ